MRWTFAGREAEVQSCIGATQRSACTVLSGVPGAGRSRVLDEVVRRVEDGDGADTVITMSASPALEDIPLGTIAALVPAVDAPAEITNDIIVRAVQAVTRRFRGSRTLFAIDDAHLLDPFSVEVLHGLMAHPNLDASLLLSVSSTAFPSRRLSELWTAGENTTITLDPLNADDVAEITGLDAGEAERLRTSTGGLVLLLHEYLSARFDRTGSLERPGDDVAELTSSRMRQAVHDVVGELNSGEQSLLEFLSFAGPAPARLFASTESTLAALERVGVLTNQQSAVAVSIPLVADVTAATLSARRRWALYSVMVARFDDAWNARGPDMFHLMLWDGRGTQTLPATRFIDATRWALDDRRLDEARELCDVACAKATDLTAHDLVLLQLEVEAAAAGEAPTSDFELLLAPGAPGTALSPAESDRAVLDSILATVQRGDMRTTTAIELLEHARRSRPDSAADSLTALVLAEIMWMNGHPQSAVSVLDGIDRSRLTSAEARVEQALQVMIGVDRGTAETSRAAARPVRRVLSAHNSRQAGAMLTAEVFGAHLCGDRADVRPAGGLIDTSDSDQSVTAGLAVVAMLCGQRSRARDLAQQVMVDELRTRAPRSLRAPLRRLVADGGIGWNTDMLRCVDGEWKRWGEAMCAAIVASNSMVHGAAQDTLDRLDELAAEHVAAGSMSTAAAVAHYSARLGAGISAAAHLRCTALTPDENPVGSAWQDHALATERRDPTSLTACGSTFARLGVAGSACDAFGAAALHLIECGEQNRAFVALVAHRLAASSVDPACVTTRAATRARLSDREFEVVSIVAAGESSAATAEQLGTSRRTVDNQLYRIYRRFDLAGRKDVADVFARASELIA